MIFIIFILGMIVIILLMVLGAMSVESTRLNATVKWMKQTMVEENLARYTSSGIFEFKNGAQLAENNEIKFP